MEFHMPGIRDRRLAAANEHRAKRKSRETGELMQIFGGGSSARRLGMRFAPTSRTGFNIANASFSRNLSMVNTIVLHQTTFVSGDALPPVSADSEISNDHRLDRVIAHFVVRADGTIVYMRDVEHTLNNGGGRHGIDIEFEGDYSHSSFPQGMRLGRRAILSARELLTNLVSLSSIAIRNIHPHGQIQKDSRSKFDSCCGPDIWVNVGEWAVANLNLNCEQPVSYYQNKGISDAQRNQEYNQDPNMRFLNDLDQMFGEIP